MSNTYDRLYNGGDGGGWTNQSSRRVRNDIPLDTIFSLLSDQRRRYALYCLNRLPGNVIELDELVQYVTAMETNSRPKQSDIDTTTATDTDVDSATSANTGTDSSTDSNQDSEVSDADETHGTAHHKLAVALLHSHLPKLANAGVLEYDARSGAIRYWVHPSLQEWIEHAERKECERRSGS